MAVNRLWFTNSPSGSISELQRCQIAVGYPFVIGNAVIVIDDTDYIRQYLGDSDSSPAISTAYSTASVDDDEDLSYLRRYLGDN